MLLLLSLLLLLLLLSLFFIPLLMLIKHGIILIHTMCICCSYKHHTYTSHTLVRIVQLYHTHRTHRTFFNINFVLFFRRIFFSLRKQSIMVSLSPVSLQYGECRSFVWLLLCVLVLTHNYVELNIFNGKLFNCLKQCRSIFRIYGHLRIKLVFHCGTM